MEQQRFEVQMVVGGNLKLTYEVTAFDADHARQKAFQRAIADGYVPFSGASVATPLGPPVGLLGGFFA